MSSAAPVPISELPEVGEDPADTGGSIQTQTVSKSTQITFHETQFFPLQRQSNIYGLLSICVNDSNKLVVSTLRGEIFYLEYHNPSIQRPPSLLPITFNYIPADAEVISIDACVREPSGLMVGVTLVKTTSVPKEVYFNLYGVQCDPTVPFSWDKIAEDWHSITLKFTPFQLCHTQIPVEEGWENVFLLAGDDLNVHLYREARLTEDEMCYLEEQLDLLFPELLDLPSSVTYMSMKMVGLHRITALGCQSGYLKCSLVDLTTNTMMTSWETKVIDGPITSVKLFTLESSGDSPDLSHYHLLVCSAIELGVVFMNILEKGFDHSHILPSSHTHDSVLCATVGDLTWDGHNELILGTYGKQLLVYKYTGDLTSSSFELVWQRGFAHPIHCVWYGDLTHDGLSELVVLSVGGIHILQHDLQQACTEISNRLSRKKDWKEEYKKDKSI